MGPAICQKCYQIGDDLADKFSHEFYADSNKILTKINGKFHLDLWKTNYLQLIKAGLNKDNIYFENTCTKCNPKIYYSARGQGIDTGRFASVIGFSK